MEKKKKTILLYIVVLISIPVFILLMMAVLFLLRFLILNQWNSFWPHQITSPEVDASILNFFSSLLVSSATVALTVYVTYKINKQTQEFTERIQNEVLEEQKRQTFYDIYYTRQMECIKDLSLDLDEILEERNFDAIQKIQHTVDHDEVFFNETCFHPYLVTLCWAYSEVQVLMETYPTPTTEEEKEHLHAIMQMNHPIWHIIREIAYQSRQGIKQGIQDQIQAIGVDDIKLTPVEELAQAVSDQIRQILANRSTLNTDDDLLA